MPTHFTQSFKSLWKQIVIFLLVIIYTFINIFQIGGDAFIINLNNFIVVPLALGTTLLSFMLWRQLKTGSLNSLLWLGLTIGWAMWTIAELWWAIASIIGQEVPFPSWADFFWLVGYIPLYFALWRRFRTLPKSSSSAQRVGVGILSLLVLGLTIVLVILPSIQASDSSAIVENIISILYPLADTLLLIFVLQLLLSYQQGMYGRAWRWIAFGFVLSSIGDLLVSYATINNLYYPEQQVNLLSTLGVDVPYNLSYLVWVVGLFLLQNLLKTNRPITKDVPKLQLVPNTHLLVFTKGDDAVIDVSRNYSQIYSMDSVKGKAISEALGLSPEDEFSILQEIKAKEILEEKPFRAHTREGQKEILISGIVIMNPQKEYSGIFLLVRLLMEDYSLDNLLTDSDQGMVRSLLSKIGAGENETAEIKKLLADYYGAHLTAFSNRAFSEGGSIFVDAFITDLRTVAKKQGWPVEIQPHSLDMSNISLPEARKVLPLLLETAKKVVIDLTDARSVNAIVQETRSKFGDLALRNVSHFESVEEKHS